MIGFGTRGRRGWSVTFFTIAMAAALACTSGEFRPSDTIVQQPTPAVQQSFSIHSVAPSVGAAPAATQPTAAASPSGSLGIPAPTSTSKPPPSVSLITFGKAIDESGNITVTGVQDYVKSGKSIAWRVELPASDGVTSVRVTVTEVSSSSSVIDQTFVPDAGSNIFYGDTVLATDPGVYVMRYYVAGVLLGEGRFTILSAPSITPRPTKQPTPKPRGDCDPSYPTVCIPPPPPDLDCGDIPYRNFKVVGDDPHRFDGDHDGIGCET